MYGLKPVPFNLAHRSINRALQLSPSFRQGVLEISAQCAALRF